MDDYHAVGGWGDLQGEYDSIEQAQSAKCDFDEAEIVDLQTRKVVFRWRKIEGWVACS